MRTNSETTPTQVAAQPAAQPLTQDGPARVMKWRQMVMALAALVIGFMVVASPSASATSPVAALPATSTNSTASTGGGTGVMTSADPRPGHDPRAGSSSVCSRSVGSGEDITNETIKYLPVYRWTESSSTHYRLGATQIAERLEKAVFQRSFLAVGNVSWGVTTSVVQWALAACFIDSVGGIVDRTAGTLAAVVIYDTPIALFLLLGCILVFAWRAARHGGVKIGADLMKKAAILTVLGIMVAGALNTTGGGANGSDRPYRPGAGSPGWFAVKIDDTIATMATSVTAAMPTQTFGGAANANKDVLHCGRYVDALHALYKDQYGGRATSVSANVPLMLSSIWESTGLTAWQVAQFGTIDGTATPDRMYCRVLEYNNGLKREEIVEVFQKIKPDIFSGTHMSANDDGNRLARDQKSLALWGSGDTGQRDQAFVAWAHCLPTGNFKFYLSNDGSGEGDQANVFRSDNPRVGLNRNGTEDGGEAGGEVAQNCADTFVGNDYKGNADHNWDNGSGTINDAQAENKLTATQANFLLSLHGVGNGNDSTAAMVYAISGILVMLVFCLIAGVILYAKIASLVVIFGLMFVTIACLMPNSDMSKIGQQAKKYVGLSMIVFGAQFILALLSLFTNILVNIGGSTLPGGGSSIIGLLWAGLAPGFALLGIHQIFKKMRVPSPISVQGGASWGKLLGAGAGIAGGAAGLNQMADGLLRRGRRDGETGSEQTHGTGVEVGAERGNEMQPKAAKGERDRDDRAAAAAADGQAGVLTKPVGDGLGDDTGGEAPGEPDTDDTGGTDAAGLGAGLGAGLAGAGGALGDAKGSPPSAKDWDSLSEEERDAFINDEAKPIEDSTVKGRLGAGLLAAKSRLGEGAQGARDASARFTNSKSFQGAKWVAKWGLVATAVSPILAMGGPLGTAALGGVLAQKVARSKAKEAMSTTEEGRRRREESARRHFEEAVQARGAHEQQRAERHAEETARQNAAAQAAPQQAGAPVAAHAGAHGVAHGGEHGGGVSDEGLGGAPVGNGQGDESNGQTIEMPAVVEPPVVDERQE